MKILLVNHFPLEGSGSGIYVKNLAVELIKRGHKVVVIVPSSNINININNIIDIVPVYFNNIKDIDFNFPCFTTHPDSCNTFYNLTDKQYDIYVSKFQEVMDKVVNKFNPDIIHSNHIWTLSKLACSYKVPVVITSHGTDLLDIDKNIRYQKDAYMAYNKASMIITISKDNYNKVKSIYGDNKLKLIYNGYNKDIFYTSNYYKKNVLKKYNIYKDYKYIVLFVGKFTHIKAVDILIKASIVYNSDDIATILAGDGILFDEMKQLAKNIENIYFINNQSQDNLRELYNIASLLVVPSRYEAFGMVAIEAMACSCPVITSNIGGLREIVNDKVGDNFETENYLSLADTISRNLDKKYDKEYIAKYAYNNYNSEISANKIIDIYNCIIK